MPAQTTGIRGFLLDAPSPETLRGFRDGAVLIEGDRILDAGEFERIRHLPEAEGVRWEFGKGCVVVPGLVDVHAHLPQYPAVARQEESLLPWLERHIFPLERNFNATAARQLAPAFFQDLAAHGVTTACLYAAIYEESCHVCFEAAESSGLRVILGKVMMDRRTYGSLDPEKVLETSLAESRRLLKRWHGAAGGRLQYAVTPRFAVTCSREMLEQAALLARESGAWLQTHLSENLQEIQTVRELFPECESYTDVYRQTGLLGPRSIFAHCIHLSGEEIQMLADSGSVVAHCPTSNLFLRSGIMPMDRLRGAGLRMGLGSDVAGGPEINPWMVMRSALESQTARSFYEDSPVPSIAQIFHLATHGGAEALGLHQNIGRIESGFDADLAVFDLGEILPGGRRLNFDADLSSEEVLGLLIHRCTPAATLRTIAAGKTVYQRPEAGLL